MGDRGRNDDADQKPSDATIGRETDVLGHQDPENEAMNALLEAMRTIAREDEVEIATFSANLPDIDQTVSEENRARITRGILRSQSTAGLGREMGQKAGQLLPKPTAAETILRIDGGQVPPVPRPKRRVLLAAAGGIVASAAGLAIWLHPVTRELPVPPYAVVASGGEKETRGGSDTNVGGDETTAPTQRLRAESELVITLRPETAVSGAVGARAFLIQGQAILEPRATTEIAPSGAIELRFHGAELVSQGHGPAVMRVVVGRPSALRAADPRAPAPKVTDAAEWRVLTVPIELGPR